MKAKYKIGQKVVYCLLEYEEDNRAGWYMKNEGVIIDTTKKEYVVRWKNVPHAVSDFFTDEVNLDLISRRNILYILLDKECICTKQELLLRKL